MVDRHFIWNFFLNGASGGLENIFLSRMPPSEDGLKWEARFFFSEEEDVTINALDARFLWCSQYRFTTHKDVYLLHPSHEENIKFRKKSLVYKPRAHEEGGLCAYRKKERYTGKEIASFLAQSFPDLSIDPSGLCREALGITYPRVGVYKEALIHSFPSVKGAKIELSRIACLGKIFTSVCIETKSKVLTQTLRAALLPEASTMHYLEFIKALYKKNSA